MELGTLLGIKKETEAMVKFLGKTRAFTKTEMKRALKTTPTVEEEGWWRRMEGDREVVYRLVENK